MSTTPAQPLSSATTELVTSLLRDGYDVRLRVAGWSMKPLFRSGALIQFSAIDDPLLGDVVLAALDNGGLVAHRVLAADERWIFTKGDACRTADGPVARDSIIACAVGWVGPIYVPLRSRFMRSCGLLLNRIYPLLVAAYRGAFARKKRSC